MEYLVGVLMALAVLIFATLLGLERDRSFYPTVLIVIASYYALFAVMSGSTRTLLAESSVIVAFVVLASLGFKRNLWIAVVGMVAHGVFDSVHRGLIHNDGVPVWWPMWCLSFDVTAGGYLAWCLYRRSAIARPVQSSRDRARASEG
jgi:hypothetical protein